MIPSNVSLAVSDQSAQLAGVLANRRWLRRTHPFPHVVAENVFIESLYQGLEEAFKEDLARMLEAHPGEKKSSLHMKNYDAYGWGFTPQISGPLSIFVSRAWHDLIANVMGVKATGDVNGGVHHHTTGSANGFIHNDFNPVWFAECPRLDGINVSDYRLIDYKHGKLLKKGIRAHETVRAVAMIFYLNNSPWSAGDGGETGLYRGQRDPVDRPAAAVPPINNSLVLFECTPYSYHTFISNRHHPRNSIVMWLHRSKDEAVARWGEDQLEYWKNH